MNKVHKILLCMKEGGLANSFNSIQNTLSTSR